MSLADFLSLVRIPLGVAFVAVAAHRTAALAIVAVSAFTDIADGWAARRSLGPESRTAPRHHGDWLDPLCDKLFVAAMVAGLYIAHRPPVALLVLLLAREMLQLIAIAVYRTGRGLRRLEPYNYRAGRVGKATTVVQFACALAILWGWREPWPLAAGAAILGIVSVVIHVRRVQVH